MAAGHGCQVLPSWAAQQVIGDYLPEGVDLRDLGEHLVRLVVPDLAGISTSPVAMVASFALRQSGGRVALVEVLTRAPTVFGAKHSGWRLADPGLQLPSL